MQFKAYRKVSPSRLRPLNERDYSERNGVIETREGPARFETGDYLGQDAAGEFKIRRLKVERDFQRISEPDADGFALYRPMDVRQAAQLDEPATLANGQQGERGDYVVKGTDSEWIVARSVFEAAYEAI